ncbi:MFS transporter [Terasakiispira papahanaumokuakeensis]|uniref:MFS transporter n=1 Tax=Terasakiispira papahanaumokuakeensis TaxID=197479 RepID=A0A1E2VAM7_9GAMM|nr:MFS transporter [Terasakiispira papahanaumokuakeensis]ODC03705.1 MFS transporter [Terasakiispira papahanaumokuakeensis]
MAQPSSTAATLSGHGIIALSAICGFAVANLYYSQPLLPQMAATFTSDVSAQGAIAMLTQAGYAVGLLLWGPLGDRLDRRRLMTVLLVINLASLSLCATASSLSGLLMACVAIGLTAVSAQIIIPAVSGLVDARHRGQVIGKLMSGLFAGTLLARTLSGFVAAHTSWRTVFELAAIIDVAMIGLIWRYLPATEATSHLPYPRLLSSLWHLLVKQPLLQEACCMGFLLFAAFNVVWAALALMLAQPPYHYDSEAVGLFGLVGAVGILASSSIGSLTDHWGGRSVVTLAAALIMLAFICVIGSSLHLIFLMISLIILDLGSRANLVANQTRLYALLPDARSRLNTVFMTSYFLGGAAGSAMGTSAAECWGWNGIAATGVLCALLALLIGHIYRKKVNAMVE